MQIRDLKLVNFRNYERLELEFNSYLNFIIGQNGMGKTNLVESIYILSLTKSFRTTNDFTLIKHNALKTKIEARIENIVLDKYSITISKEGKNVKINEKKVSRLSDYISKISVILFSPSDLRIIKDTPSIRRKMLNIEISQLNNSYLKKLQEYNQLVKQRNSYLKTMYINANASNEYLDILTSKIIDTGLFLSNARKKFVSLLNQNISDIFLNITNDIGLNIIYNSDYNDMTKEGLFELYKKSEERDIMLGKTTIGIHHDDIIFSLNGESLKDYGSEGQQKNAIIAMKLAEINIFYQLKKTYPILILDDLFSELDKEKIENIIGLLNHNIQTFITTTDLDKINLDLLEDYKIFKVSNEEVEEVNYE